MCNNHVGIFLLQVTVNKVPISSPDIFTLGGIVNVIDGLLHPVLHICNQTIKSVEYVSTLNVLKFQTLFRICMA